MLRPFATTPFASLGRLQQTVTASTFLEAVGLWLTANLPATVRPYVRPQGDEKAMYIYRVPARTYNYTHYGNAGFVSTTFALAANSTDLLEARQLDLQARDFLDRFEGVVYGRRIQEVVSGSTTVQVEGESTAGGWRYSVETEYTILHDAAEVAA